MDLKTIIQNSGNMSARPEYYSGRGATLSDLNTDILYKIREGILLEFGEDAALNFVRMVNGIKVLSATTFLKELYHLSLTDWKFTPKETDMSGLEVAKNEDGEYNIASGMATIFGALSNDRDDTRSIKGNFCRAFLPPEELPKPERRHFQDGYGFYEVYD